MKFTNVNGLCLLLACVGCLALGPRAQAQCFSGACSNNNRLLSDLVMCTGAGRIAAAPAHSWFTTLRRLTPIITFPTIISPCTPTPGAVARSFATTARRTKVANISLPRERQARIGSPPSNGRRRFFWYWDATAPTP